MTDDMEARRYLIFETENTTTETFIGRIRKSANSIF